MLAESRATAMLSKGFKFECLRNAKERKRDNDCSKRVDEVGKVMRSWNLPLFQALGLRSHAALVTGSSTRGSFLQMHP